MSRNQTIREERLNSLTHGGMALVLLLTMPLVLVYVIDQAGQMALRDGIGVAVFLLCLIMMFATSGLYHGVPAGSRYKPILNRLDHMAIFFAIAGSYTPLVLSVIRGRAGWIILAVEWSLVVIGVIFKSLSFKKNLASWIVSILLYLAMGWAIAVCFPLFAARAHPACLWLIITGGIFYTVGIVFFALEKKYSHVIWHFFVNMGAISHFTAIVFFMR
jgi:hemolysin III